MKKDLTALLIAAAFVAVLCLCVNVQTPAEYYAVHPEAVGEGDAAEVRIDARAALNSAVPDEIEALLKDGELLAPARYAIVKNETPLSLLKKVCRYKKILLDTEGEYVKGIGELYQFDGGALSGWMVTINGVLLTRGGGSVRLKDGDRVAWIYTLSLGDDLYATKGL